MAETLRSLLDIDRFKLRLVVPPAAEVELDSALSWAHSSDLPDPTPWLEPGQLLLTDGDHFVRHGDQESADAYFDRLRAAGVVGLGFATGVIHAEIPPAVIHAAKERGFPLLEVADRVPFMAIIRQVADSIAIEARRRLDWLLGAQRAISRAALRVDGLRAILRELEDSLGGWVVLFDAAGNRVEVPSKSEIPPELESSVEEVVRKTLRARMRSGGRISVLGSEVTLQTLGRRDDLRGVLVIGSSAPLDAAEADLVESVIALASIALEQSRALEESRRFVRAGALELLLAGQIEAAARSVEAVGGPLPSDPVRLAVVAGGPSQHMLVEELELGAQRGGGIFFALRGDRLVVITAADSLDELGAVLARHRARGGVSGPFAVRELPRALGEAERALAWASDDGPLARFDDDAARGMIGALERAGGAEIARRLLDRLVDRPDSHELVSAARTWLECNGAWESAAKQLGIHRHTLRARVDLLGEILGLDLEVFADRVELWAALEFSRSDEM